MLLTIHNLPTNITYAELKTLIYNKCGLADTILDHLVKEGGAKKVTIGVADEGDAAILVQNINGLILNGQRLYVEDVRKQRSTEKPYHSTSVINYQMPYYQTIPGYNSITDNQNVNTMAKQSPVENYNQMDYYVPTDQNLSSMGNSNQSQSFAPKQTPYSNLEQPYGYETQRVEATYKGTSSLDKNNRHGDPHIHSPKRSQGRDQNFPNTSKWVMGNPVAEKEYPKRTPRESWNARDRGQINLFRQSDDNYRDQKNAFRSSNDNYRERANAFGPTNEEYDFRPLNDNYRDQGIAFGPSNDDYRGKQNAFRPSNDNCRDQGNTFGPPNEDYRKQKNFRAANDDYRGQGSGKDMAGDFGQDTSYNTDYGVSTNQGRVINPINLNLYGSKIYGNHVTESQVRSSVPNKWIQKEELQTKRFQISNKFDIAVPQSHLPSEKNINRFENALGFEKKSRKGDYSHELSGFGSNRFDNIDVSPVRGSVTNRKSFESRPTFTSSRSEKKPFSRSEKESFERESLKRGHKGVDRDSELTIKRFKRDTHGIQSIKFRQTDSKSNKIPESNTIKTINKDQTWRGQAAARIAKQVMQKFKKGKRNVRILQRIKLSVRTRIDVLLSDRFSVPSEEIVQLYRKRFPFKYDKEFYDAVAETERIAQIERLQSTSNQNVIVFNAAKDTMPKIYKTAMNVPEDESVTTQQPTTSKTPSKQEPLANVSKACNLVLDPNLTGKAMGKAQKKVAKLEFYGDQVYTLPNNLQEALDKEMHTFVDIFKEECAQPKNAAEKSICDQIPGVIAEDFKKVVSLIVTKRICDVRTGLVLRVLGIPKPPKKTSLIEFLKHYGGGIINKSETKKMFVVTVDSYEKYDELCGLGSVLIDDITVKFSPMNITGPPPKITRAQILQKRNKWIQNQIEKDSKIEEGVAQNNSKVSQLEDVGNSDSIPQEDDNKDNTPINVQKVNEINQECIIIEDKEKTDIIDLDVEDETETTVDERKVEKLLEVELDEDNFEDY